MKEEEYFKFYDRLGTPCSALVVGWGEDVGGLGYGVADHLISSFKGKMLAEIETQHFFSMSGVGVEAGVAQFPRSLFYYCPEPKLLVFKSNPPRYNWYRFLSLVLDLAHHYCSVNEIYSVGGMISGAAHTAPRLMMAVANLPGIADNLGRFHLSPAMDYETPPGQRPTISSYLLWLAAQRQVPGFSLWIPVPFYLASLQDPRSWHKTLDFFSEKLGLGLDLSAVESLSREQGEKIARMRQLYPDIDEAIRKLETSLAIEREESESLVEKTEMFFRQHQA